MPTHIYAIENIAHAIEDHDFSPLEAAMYAYDIARDRTYNSKSPFEDPKVSRDLSQVLFGDKIVCAGFANIFDAVLNRLGIKSMVFILQDNETKDSHALVVAFIEDNKCGVKGIYYFDPTWDCKEEHDEFLASYCYFAKTKSEMEQLHEGIFDDLTIGNFSRQYCEELKTALARDEVYKFPHSKKHDINEISRLVDGIRLFPTDGISRAKINAKVNEYLNFMDSPLSEEIYLTVLFNVRKIQYYENPRRFPFSLEALTDIYYNSNWHKANLATLISPKEDGLEKSVTREKVEKKIAQIKLARLLKTQFEKQKTLILK